MVWKIRLVLLTGVMGAVCTPAVAMDHQQDKRIVALPQRAKGETFRNERTEEKKQLARKSQEALHQPAPDQLDEEPTYHVPGPYYKPSVEEKLRMARESMRVEIWESIENSYKNGLTIQPNQWPHEKEGVRFLYAKGIIIPIDELPQEKALAVLRSFRELGIKISIEELPQKKAIKVLQLFQKAGIKIPIEELPKEKAVVILRLFQEAGIIIPIDELPKEKAFELLRWCQEAGIKIPIDKKLPQEKAVKVSQLIQEFQEQQEKLRQQEMERRAIERAKEQARQEERRKLLEVEKRRLLQEREKKLLEEKSRQQSNKEVLEERKRKQLEQKLRNVNKVLAATAPVHNKVAIKPIENQSSQQKNEKSIPHAPITLVYDISSRPSNNTVDEELQRRFEKLRGSSIETPAPQAMPSLAITLVHDKSASCSDDWLGDLERRLQTLKAPEVPVHSQGRDQEKFRAVQKGSSSKVNVSSL